MRSSTVLSSIVAAFLLLPATQMVREQAGDTVIPAACQNGNSKYMTGSVGNASCLSKIEVPISEGGEARDPEAAPVAPEPQPEPEPEPEPEPQPLF